MPTVKATREGLVGQTTASGYLVDPIVLFVALPSRAALWLPVWLINHANGKTTPARVLDIGPHHTDDHAYVFGGARPRAESDPGSNRAGIDLGEAVWQALGMTDNTEIEWQFAVQDLVFSRQI